MKNSEMLRLLSEAHRKCGNIYYAEILTKEAIIKEAEEIIQEHEIRTKGGKNGTR